MNMAERLEIVNHASEVMDQVNRALVLVTDRIRALERERDYLRKCLIDVLAYGNINPVCNGVEYEPGWLRNARDAATGKIDHYPVIEK